MEKPKHFIGGTGNFLAGLFLLGLSGCGGYYAIPTDVLDTVDRSVSFEQLRAEPDSFKGKTIVLGGVVLNATQVQEGTLIEVLQLPMSRFDRPYGPAENSLGRFLIVDPSRTDPAVISKRAITVAGEVMESRTRLIDDFEYRFPTLNSTFIRIWPAPREPAYYGPYPYYSPWYPYGYPYYYPYPPVYPHPDRHFGTGNSAPPKKKKRRFE